MTSIQQTRTINHETYREEISQEGIEIPLSLQLIVDLQFKMASEHIQMGKLADMISQDVGCTDSDDPFFKLSVFQKKGKECQSVLKIFHIVN